MMIIGSTGHIVYTHIPTGNNMVARAMPCANTENRIKRLTLSEAMDQCTFLCSPLPFPICIRSILQAIVSYFNLTEGGGEKNDSGKLRLCT